jgi:hypothetical protein
VIRATACFGLVSENSGVMIRGVRSLFVDGEDDPMSSPDAGFGPDNAQPFVQCIQLYGYEESGCIDQSFVQDGGNVDLAHFFRCRGCQYGGGEG